MLTVQYHDIKDDANLETWRGMGYQTVLAPPNLATGKVDLSLREGAQVSASRVRNKTAPRGKPRGAVSFG